MTSHRISVRIPRSLERRLKQRSQLRGAHESEVVREALETYLAKTVEERSAYTLAVETGVIGCVRGAPKDLSTNKRHFENFGKGK